MAVLTGGSERAADALKRLVRLLLFPVFRPLVRLVNGQTLGVRCIVVEDDARVLLVQHSYTPGWSLPGGGVKRGETLGAALARELEEEAGIALDEVPRLLGVFANFRLFPGDHVVVFVARRWHRDEAAPFSLEITERHFFPLDALPEGATPGTRRRLAEWRDGAAVSESW